MCLILTIVAAVLTTFAWRFMFTDKKYMLSRLALMYWGASLMWSVDGIFSIAEGEGFFNLTLDDTYLGIVVVFSGLAVWAIMLVTRELKHLAAAR